MEKQEQIIKGLQSPTAFPHAVGVLEVIETHISWVVLTGEYAYKIKKAVNFGFLDFSTLAKRKQFCELEVKRNQAYSQGIYLDVVEIKGDWARPLICDEGGNKDSTEDSAKGEVLEYAVKMKQFEVGKLFSELAQSGNLSTAHIEQLAHKLVDIHNKAQPKLANTLRLIEKACLANIKALSWPATFDADDLAMVEELGDWTIKQLTQLQSVFQARERAGRVRLCHGDLHLGNITLADEEPIFFDCIEFNDELSTVDTQSELAFVLMDLEFRQQMPFANLLLNRYLQLSGDYIGLNVLNFYKVYRALVRAKVNGLQSRQEQQFVSRTKCQLTYVKYLSLAKTYLRTHIPGLTIMHGVSASGKTTKARLFASENRAIHISSDIERKRMFGISETETSNSDLDAGIYSEEATQKIYNKLLKITEIILDSGYSVVVDASFLRRSFREKFQKLALNKNISFYILHCEAASENLGKRLEERAKDPTSVSEAGIDILNQQLARQESLTEREQKYVLGKF